MKILLLLLLAFPSFATKHYNVLRNGDNYVSVFPTTVRVGDTVVLKGNYGVIEITNIDGVTFINEGIVNIRYFNLWKGAKNVNLLGNQTAGLKYGIIITNTGEGFGMNWECVGNMEVAGIRITRGGIGFKLSTIPNTVYPLTYQNMYFHDSQIDSTGQEAVYFGRDELGGPFITARIERIDVRFTGRDGIQVRNGTFKVNYNIVDSVGRKGEGWHDEGILFGGNTNGGECIGNTVRRVPGNALWINGYGTFKIDDNNLSSKDASIFTTDAQQDAENIQRVMNQTFEITNNVLRSYGTNYVLQMYKRATGIPVTLRYGGNITNQGSSIAQGITVTAITTPAPTPTKIILARVFIGGYEWILYSDKTVDVR